MMIVCVIILLVTEMVPFLSIAVPLYFFFKVFFNSFRWIVYCITIHTNDICIYIIIPQQAWLLDDLEADYVLRIISALVR